MHIPFFTSGVKAIIQFFAFIISYLTLFTVSDTDFNSLSLVSAPCFTKQSRSHRLKFLCVVLGPQIKVCNNRSSAVTKILPDTIRSICASDGGRSNSNLKIKSNVINFKNII